MAEINVPAPKAMIRPISRRPGFNQKVKADPISSDEAAMIARFRREAAAAGIDYVALPMTAHLWSKPPVEGQVRNFFHTALDPSRRPLFIHCTHGVDRTGTMAALYRIEAQGWQPPAAVEEMRVLGFHGWFRALRRYVESYAPRGYATPPGAAPPAPDQGAQAR